MDTSRCRFLHQRTANPPDLYSSSQVSLRVKPLLTNRTPLGCPPGPPLQSGLEECWPSEALGPDLAPGLHQGVAAVGGLQAMGGTRSGQEESRAKALVNSLHHKHYQFGHSALDR